MRRFKAAQQVINNFQTAVIHAFLECLQKFIFLTRGNLSTFAISSSK